MGISRTLLALALVPLAAPAAAGAPGELRCTVERAERLPTALGGADGLCRAIRQAAVSAKVRPRSVAVTVLSPASLVAKVVGADGRQLPEQRLARSDGQLSRAAVERFARAIAAAAASAHHGDHH